MHFTLLADRIEAVPIVARWSFDEWGHAAPGNTFEQTCARISGKLNRDRAPLHVLAIEDDQLLGVAQLKLREMSVYPECEHWLGDVYVRTESRGRCIASALCNKIQSVAFSFGIRSLHLQTERLDGGLYARLGWRGVDRVRYNGHDVLVMERMLNGPAAG
jgi:GNAT superfamily N-acetyltransferase